MNRPQLGQGKAAGCPQGKEEARMAPPPRPPDPLFPPPPPPRDLPGRFPQQARPNASYPCLPSSLPRTGVRRPAARPTHRPSHPRGPPRRTPLAVPSGSSRVARGGLEEPGREVGEACRGYLPQHEPGVKRLREGVGQGRCRAYGWALSRGGAPGWSPWHPLFSHTLGVGVK